MAIGVNWKEIWSPVWAAVWTQEAPGPQPEPEVVAQTPAGKKRRLYVEVDGQTFEVESAQHARAILDRAKQLATEAAQEAADAIEAKPATKVTPVKLEIPKIKASPELALDLTQVREQIARVYNEAAIALEIRLLLKRQEEQDEEEAILLLM